MVDRKPQLWRWLLKYVKIIQNIQNIQGHKILSDCILSQIESSRYIKSPHFVVEFETGVVITEQIKQLRHKQIILSFKNNTYIIIIIIIIIIANF